MNNTKDSKNNLYDSRGDQVGKIDYDGSVRDGYRDKGRVTDDGKYIDEYGNDQGWVVQDSRRNSSPNIDFVNGGGTFCLLGILTFGFYWLAKWVMADPKRTKWFMVICVLTIVFVIVPFFCAISNLLGSGETTEIILH